MKLRNESRVPVAVNYQLRFSRVVEDLKGLMRDHPRRILITYTADAGIRRASRSDWKRSTDSGGGIAYAVGSHLIELLYSIGLRPVSVIERAAGLKLFHVAGELAGGGEWEVFADGRRRRAEFTIRIELPSRILSVDMIEGSIQEVHGRTPSRLTHPVSRLRSSEPSPWRTAFERCVLEMIGATGAISLSKCATVEDALRVHLVLEGAAATRRTRVPVEIPQLPLVQKPH
jgi:predicted dehydrogenase